MKNRFVKFFPDEIGGGFFDKIKGTLSDLGEKLEDTLEIVKDKAGDVFEQATEAVKGNETLNNLVDKGKDLVEQAQDKIGDVVENVKSSDALSSLTEKGKGIIEQAQDKIGDVVENVKGKVSGTDATKPDEKC